MSNIKITSHTHTNVAPDGKLKGRNGSINPNPGISTSAPGGGCDLPDCHCSPGHWVTATLGRHLDGTMTSVCVHFGMDDEAEKRMAMWLASAVLDAAADVQQEQELEHLEPHEMTLEQEEAWLEQSNIAPPEIPWRERVEPDPNQD